MAVESCGDIHALPEDCIANALSLTSPKDACRLSLVASTFRSASLSDAVWDRFLPSDYRDVISRSIDGPDSFLAQFNSKKDLYLHLSDHPILIDAGRKSFSLEKESGKKCFFLAARELFIVWGDTPQYWKWYSLPESRFSEVAELNAVCWFEIRGKISMKMLSPATNYAAYLVYDCESYSEGFDDLPVEGYVWTDGHESQKRTFCLVPEGHRRRGGRFNERLAHDFDDDDDDDDDEYDDYCYDDDDEDIVDVPPMEYPKKRDGDGWWEVELGEYFVEGGEDGDLEMSVMEVKTGNWKGGLVFQGIEIRPKHVSM